MSIEKALADLTAALDRNTAALTASPPAAKSSKKAASETPAAAPAPAAAATVTPPSPPVAPVAAAAATPTIPMKAAADALVALAETKDAAGKDSRDAAIAVLGEFGAKTLPGLSAEKYGPFIERAKVRAAEIAAAAKVQPTVTGAAGLY